MRVKVEFGVELADDPAQMAGFANDLKRVVGAIGHGELVGEVTLTVGNVRLWRKVRCERCLAESGDTLEPEGTNPPRAVEFYQMGRGGPTRCEACTVEVEKEER